MSDRLSDEQVARVAAIQRPLNNEAEAFVLLAREVLDSRRRLAAIRALPDTAQVVADGVPERGPWLRGYAHAMRQVKALLDGVS